MSNKNIPLINGVRHSWASVRVNLLGRTVTGIAAIKYEDEVEKQNNYGAGGMPTHRGEGIYTATASITLKSFEVDAIQRSLGVGKRLQEIEPFEIIVSYLPKGSAGLVTHTLRNVEFMKNVRDLKQGDADIDVELPLILSHVDWN